MAHLKAATSTALIIALISGCASRREPAPEKPSASAPWASASRVGEPSDRVAGTPALPAPAPEPEPMMGPPAPSEVSKPVDDTKELVAGLRLSRSRKLIEVDAIVPIDAHDAEAPRVYLEVICCTPDSKEHETLVMTKVPASQLHAALLLIGLEPGKVGYVGWDGKQIRADRATGPKLNVTFRTRNERGESIDHDPASWVINAKSGKTLREEFADAGWVFAGSGFRTRKDPATGKPREFYDADVSGTVIGLHTFSTETIAFDRAMSPDANVQEPEWIANGKLVPKAKSPVTIVIGVK